MAAVVFFSFKFFYNRSWIEAFQKTTQAWEVADRMLRNTTLGYLILSKFK